MEKRSIASASSFQFGGERTVNAQRGPLEGPALEDSCSGLSADGEKMASACESFAFPQ